MRLIRIVAIVVLLAALPVALTAAPAGAQTAPTLVAVRAAHHPGFDRVTFQFSGGLPSHQVRYVSQLTEDPSDRPVSLAGSANLLVVFHGANAHDESGQSTVSPQRFSPNLPSLKEVALIGDFEAVVSYGLGISHQVPFRVFTLSGPPRVVIDISTAGRPVEELPFTGSHATTWLLGGIGLLALGGAALVLGSRRTRRS